MNYEETFQLIKLINTDVFIEEVERGGVQKQQIYNTDLDEEYRQPREVQMPRF